MLDKREMGSRLRHARKERGLTLKDLEARARVSATHLSEIERGLTSPTIQVLVRIAAALERPTEFFLESTRLETVAHLPVERRAPGTPVGDGALALPLTAGIAGHRLGVCLLRLTVGTDSEVEEPPHAGSVALLVLSGSVRVVAGERAFVLETGDALHVRCDRNLVIQNASAVAPAEVLWAADRRPNLPQRGTSAARAGAASR